MPDRWTVLTLDRDVTWRIVRNGDDGAIVEAAVIRWLVDVHPYPALTRERMARGMNAELGVAVRVPARTWGWQPVRGTYRAELQHNGRTVAEVEWATHVRGKADLMTAIAAGLNEDRGRADPFPEPAPPPPRRWDLEPGDHDHATGEDIAA